MSICTFFAQKNTPNDLETELKLLEIMEELIVTGQADKFYVGNQGLFAETVIDDLIMFKREYPHIEYAVIAVKPPFEKSKNEDSNEYIAEIIKEEIAEQHRKKVLKWMIDNSDLAVVFVNKTTGITAEVKVYAEEQGLTVINLADM